MDPTARQGRRYSGLAADERVRQRREAILKSALEQYGTNGYAATSIKQICRGANVTERNFYESFPNQESCLAALYNEVADATRSTTLAALEGPDTDLDALAESGLRAFISYLTSDPRRARVMFIEVVGVSADMEQRRHAVLRDFVETIAATWSAGRQGLLSRGQRLTATALVGGVNHLLVDWLMDGRDDDPADLVTVCANMFAASRAQWDNPAHTPGNLA